MTALSFRTDDPFARHGIDHFMVTSGISFDAVKDGEVPVEVAYGTPPHGKFAVTIRQHAGFGEITGYVTAFGKRAPVFGKPSETGRKEAVIAVFDGPSGSYPCASLDAGGIDIGFDLFGEAGHILAGDMDARWSRTAGPEKRGLAAVPFLDFSEDLLLRCILEGCRRQNVPLVRKSAWPYGAGFAVCCTHDIDEIRKTYQWITYPLRSLRHLDLAKFRRQATSLGEKIRGREPYWTFGDMASLERELGVTSTSFFLEETAPVEVLRKASWKHSGRRYRFGDPAVADVMRELDQKGHEIGLHGSYNSFADLPLLRKEKADLEKALGREVRGIRQHNLRLRIPDTWDIQEKAGLGYDSTLGFNDTVGFRGGTSSPFRPFHPREKRAMGIVEIPLIIQDTALFRQGNPWEDFLEILHEVQRYRGVLTLLWHHVVFNRNEFPGWGETYREIIRHCQREGAWIATAGGIAEWWSRRSNATVESSYEDGVLRIRAGPRDGVRWFSIHHPGPIQPGTISGGRVISREEGSTIIETGPGDTPAEITFTSTSEP
ncbi:MAG TPA: hypothetical protein VMB35_07220 [Methanomicrobiales archaeon]|nr:hypothetical protein [Methanomicrobiales archaeon]